ncbi:MAG: type II toxin-antitoxin system RelE/ParE family toxin [Pseudomonadota bacterium]
MIDQDYRVEEKPDVLLDYITITEHIERWTEDRDLADRTIDAIQNFVKGIPERPHRGTKSDDLRPGRRIVPFKKRTAIAFEVDEERRMVTILRVFYGGQDYDTVMRR